MRLRRTVPKKPTHRLKERETYVPRAWRNNDDLEETMGMIFPEVLTSHSPALPELAQVLEDEQEMPLAVPAAELETSMEDSYPSIEPSTVEVSQPSMEFSAQTWKREKVIRVSNVQQGHTKTEQELYETLWRLAGADPIKDQFGLVQIGYIRLSRIMKMSDKGVRNCLQSLERKLTIETLPGNTKLGQTYKVFSYRVILAKRRELGMEWVRRNRGVEFIDTSMVVSQTSMEVSTTDVCKSKGASMEVTTMEVSQTSMEETSMAIRKANYLEKKTFNRRRASSRSRSRHPAGSRTL